MSWLQLSVCLSLFRQGLCLKTPITVHQRISLVFACVASNFLGFYSIWQLISCSLTKFNKFAKLYIISLLIHFRFAARFGVVRAQFIYHAHVTRCVTRSLIMPQVTYLVYEVTYITYVRSITLLMYNSPLNYDIFAFFIFSPRNFR